MPNDLLDILGKPQNEPSEDLKSVLGEPVKKKDSSDSSLSGSPPNGKENQQPSSSPSESGQAGTTEPQTNAPSLLSDIPQGTVAGTKVAPVPFNAPKSKTQQLNDKIDQKTKEKWTFRKQTFPTPDEKINNLTTEKATLDQRYKDLLSNIQDPKERYKIIGDYQKELDAAADKNGLIKKGDKYVVPEEDITDYNKHRSEAIQEIAEEEDKDKRSWIKGAWGKLNAGAASVDASLASLISIGNFDPSKPFKEDYKKWSDYAEKNYKTASEYADKKDYVGATGAIANNVVESIPLLVGFVLGNKAGTLTEMSTLLGLGEGEKKYDEIKDLDIPQSSKIFNAIGTSLNFIALARIGGGEIANNIKTLVSEVGADEANVLLQKSTQSLLQKSLERVYQATSPALKGYAIGVSSALSNNLLEKATTNPDKDLTEGLNESGLTWALMNKISTTGKDIETAKQDIQSAMGKIPKNIPFEDVARSTELLIKKNDLLKQNEVLDETFQKPNKDKIDDIKNKIDFITQPRVVKEKVNILNNEINAELQKDYPNVNKLADYESELKSIEDQIKTKMFPLTEPIDKKIEELRKENESLDKEDVEGTKLEKQAERKKEINSEMTDLLRQKQDIKQKFYDETIKGIDDPLDQQIYKEDKDQAYDELGIKPKTEKEPEPTPTEIPTVEKDVTPVEKELNDKVESTPMSLQKESIPIVSGLVKDAVVPVAKSLKDGFMVAAKFLSPKSFASKSVKDILNETLLGQLNESKSKLDMMLRPMEKMFDKMSNEDNTKFVDNNKLGKSQGSKELDEVAGLINKIGNDLYTEKSKYKPGLPYKENHERVFWKVIPQSEEYAQVLKDYNAGEKIPDIAKKYNLTEDEVNYTVQRATQKGFKGLGKNPLRGTMGSFKKSTLDTMSEGIERGGIPYSYNPITMFKLEYADDMKFITANRMWDALKEDGLRKFVKKGGVVPEGFSRINDRIAEVYFPTEQGLVGTGDWFVDDGAARLINNYLSKDYIRSNDFGKGLMWLKNNYTAIELGLSAFHATAETLETIGSTVGEGLRKMFNLGILQGNVKKGLEGITDIISAPITPVTKISLANKAIGFLGEKDFIKTDEGKSFIKKYPDAANLLHDYFAGGGKIGMAEDYKTNAVKVFKSAIKEKSEDPAYQYIKNAVLALPALNEMLMTPLFDYYIPRLKLAMFLREHNLSLMENAKRLENGDVTRTELARKNMSFVDDRLGEMNFDNLFWDRTFKTSMQFMFRSVTWKLGNLRAIGGAPVEQAIEFRNAFREKRAPMLSPKMAWLFGLTAMQVAAATILQRMYTGKQPQTFEDIVAPRINENDEKERVILPTYFKDMLHFSHAPVKYVTGSFAGDIGRFYDLQQNKDFFGYEIYDPQATMSEKAKEIGSYFLPKPFSFTNLLQMKEKGEPPSKQALSFLGFTKAPKYITNTPIENEIGDLYNMNTNLKRAYEAKGQADVKRQILDLYKGGKEDQAYDLMSKSVTEGKLRANQTEWLLRNINKKADIGEYMFKMLPYDDKLYLYNKMSTEEKQKYDPKGNLKKQFESEAAAKAGREEVTTPEYYKYKGTLSKMQSAFKQINDITKEKGEEEGIKYAKKHKLDKEYTYFKDNRTEIGKLNSILNKFNQLPEKDQKEYKRELQDNVKELNKNFKRGEDFELSDGMSDLYDQIKEKGDQTEEQEDVYEELKNE
jgi:hypothetical protein